MTNLRHRIEVLRDVWAGANQSSTGATLRGVAEELTKALDLADGDPAVARPVVGALALADSRGDSRGNAEASAESTTEPRWRFGPRAAAHLIAATSWPWERKEDRDEWSVRLIDEPDLLETEAAQARARLEAAIAALGGPSRSAPKTDEEVPAVDEAARIILIAHHDAVCSRFCNDDVSTYPLGNIAHKIAGALADAGLLGGRPVLTVDRDDLDGGFIATAHDVPGAIGQGETVGEALADLMAACRAILAAALREATPETDEET